MSTLLQKLATSAERLAALRAEVRAEKARRDGLICEAIDLNERAHSYPKVARAARLRSVGTVAAIVGKGHPDKQQ